MLHEMTKPAALLIHSGGFTSRQWRKLAEQLGESHRVLAPDLLGYDESAPWPDGKPFHFDRDLEHLESLLQDVDAPLHLVGHSYGGFLALKLALRHPALVESIAVYEPVSFGILDRYADPASWAQLERVRTDWRPDASGVDEAWLAEFVDWWNGAGSWHRLPEPTRASFRRMGWKMFQEVMSLASDRTPAAAYGAIAAPALLMAGADSPAVEQLVVQRLGDALQNATLRIFAGMGHMGPVSHAAIVNAAIVEHLRR